MKNANKTAILLTFAGAIPFFIALTILWLDVDVFGYRGAILSHAYGILIASFIAGTQWGMYLLKPTGKNLFVWSNVLFFLIASSLFFFAELYGFLILIASYGLALWIDVQSFNAGLFEEWYIQMRKKITSIVVAVLLLTTLALL